MLKRSMIAVAAACIAFGAQAQTASKTIKVQSTWGAGFTLRRFHAALLDLGAPPLGLLGTAVERG